MRVVQHKPPTNTTTVTTADLEDCTGLTVNNLIPVIFSLKLNINCINGRILLICSLFFSHIQQPPNINTDHVSGAPVKGNVDYTPQAAQVAHAMKPPKCVSNPHTVQHHINQPRKFWLIDALIISGISQHWNNTTHLAIQSENGIKRSLKSEQQQQQRMVVLFWPFFKNYTHSEHCKAYAVLGIERAE